jgi:hypothetical protein
MEKGRLVAALGRRDDLLPSTSHCIFRKEALLLQRRRDLVQRPLRLVLIDGVHEVVEVVQFIIFMLFAFGPENFHGRDL